MARFVSAVAFGLALLLPQITQPQITRAAEPAWLPGYHEALDAAEAKQQLAFIWFYDPLTPELNDQFAATVLNNEQVAQKLNDNFSLTRLPIDVQIESSGQQVALLRHPAFAEMLGRPGLAIVDMTAPASPLFRQVVSVCPFTRSSLSLEHVRILLDLPRGSLTQRTLIFAVRTHPDQPASTIGEFSPLLTRETENHAWHQASIGLQGHHNWDARFHAINAQLPGGLLAREVCAESWPGQSLVDAAEECVDSWRQSPGHWSAVSSRHNLFAYDMKRGANGIWYATGIFASR